MASSCPVCQKLYSRVDNLKRHQKSSCKKAENLPVNVAGYNKSNCHEATDLSLPGPRGMSEHNNYHEQSDNGDSSSSSSVITELQKIIKRKCDSLRKITEYPDVLESCTAKKRKKDDEKQDCTNKKEEDQYENDKVQNQQKLTEYQKHVGHYNDEDEDEDEDEEYEEEEEEEEEVEEEESSKMMLKACSPPIRGCCCFMLHTDPNELVNALRFYINSNYSLQSTECQAIVHLLRQRNVIF